MIPTDPLRIYLISEINNLTKKLLSNLCMMIDRRIKIC